MGAADTGPRIVSLVPSATEIIFALGLGDHLVGRSHECDFPPEVATLPVCTAARIDAEAPSHEIDRQVKAALGAEGSATDALSIYRVDGQLIARLQPDLILTQSQCTACAVSLEDVHRALRTAVWSQPQILSLEPAGLDDVFDDIQRVGQATGATDRAQASVASLQNRLEVMRQKTSPLSARPTVFCVEWIEPLMSAGNWVPQLVEAAGGRCLLAEAGQHSHWLQMDELASADPDVIVVMPCGFDLERTRREMDVLAHDGNWQQLRAVREGRVYLTDGHAYFNRPGPRLVDSAEILAEILHPDHFDFGHVGVAWQGY